MVAVHACSADVMSTTGRAKWSASLSHLLCSVVEDENCAEVKSEFPVSSQRFEIRGNKWEAADTKIRSLLVRLLIQKFRCL